MINRRRALSVLTALLATGHGGGAWAQRDAPALLLAGRYRPGIDLGDYWVSEKYDGVRGVWDGRQLTTRGGERVNAPDWFTHGWPATPMDGELWAGRGAFEHAQSTIGRAQAGDDAWRRMRFMVFDLPAHPGHFDERLAALRSTVAAIGQPWVVAVPQRKVADDAELQAWLRDVVRGGGEGLMLHRADATYTTGRSDALLKMKLWRDAEAEVIGHQPGKGKYAGMLGALKVRTADGAEFMLGTGFSDAERRNPPPIGTTVTYRYRELTKRGVPRFASFHRVRDL